MRPGLLRASTGLVATLGLALWPTAVGATWSIAAVDPSTREVGVAVASCVEAPYGSTILPFVAGLAPGRGALVAQALYGESQRDQALALLRGGAAPQQVIDVVVAGDPRSATRQYGVALLDLRTAAFTGADAEAWAGHRQGRGVTVQGNILRGPAVVADALAAFEAAAPGCPWTLADRLMLALEAGAARGGDSRCDEPQAALAAVLRVASPADDPEAPTLDLRIPSQPEGGDPPVARLRAAYDQWRRDHPPVASSCTTLATPTGTSRATAAAARERTDPRTESPSPREPSPPGEADEAGCRCRATVDPSWGVPLLLLVAPVRRRAAPRR